MSRNNWAQRHGPSALFFSKLPGSNWSIGWHQDRTIVVRERREVSGYGPWTRKTGLLHVQPPASVLAKMITIRIHFDAVPQTNAPNLIAPGSHRLGRIPEQDVASTVQTCGTFACLAAHGDIWAYRTLILHASDAAIQPTHRRVLQVDYAAEPLPGGLQWLGL